MVAPTFEKEQIRAQLPELDFPLILLKDDPFEMIDLADVVLAASGTATLMVGLLEKPMVIMYRLKWLTGLIARLVVRGVRFFGIVNLISGREIVPERWQGGASAENLYPLMARYVEDLGYRSQVTKDLKEIRKHLGDVGATRRVSDSLKEYLEA
jgi:lipid-A-disaccharide synthase